MDANRTGNMNLTNNVSLANQLNMANVTAPSRANSSQSATSALNTTAGRTFGDALVKAVDVSDKLDSKLKFSKHAAIRLNSRQVELSTDQLKRVEAGVSAAGQKGILDSLVLVDGYALVVNTRSMTVVTAMDYNQTGSQSDLQSESGLSRVFTNINGAVIV